MKPIRPSQLIGALAIGAYSTVYVSMPMTIFGYWIMLKNWQIGLPILALGIGGVLMSSALLWTVGKAIEKDLEGRK